MTIKLADTAGGALFTVSDSDWVAIANRVQTAIKLSNIADEVTEYLPEFKALVASCVRWRDQSYPTIMASAQALDSYCGQALRDFTSLQDQLSGSLTSGVKQQVVDALRGLNWQTTSLNVQIHQAASEVADFAQINRAVDARVDAYVNQLGGNWKSILPETGRVDNAAGRVRGVWVAMSADLTALVGGSIDVTNEFIASLGIEAALKGWTVLQSEARAFLNKPHTVLT